MQRLVPFGLVISLLACGGTSAPPPVPAPEAKAKVWPAYVGPRLRVAVATFAEEEPNKPQLDQSGFKDIAPLLEEQLVTELVRTGRVTVLERKQLKKVAGEVDLAHGEMAEYFAKSEKVEKGKFLQAQAMFAGAVTEFEPDAAGLSGGVTVAGVGASAGYKTARVGIEVRLVDVTTGRVIEATHAEGTATRLEGEAGISYMGIKVGGGGYYKTPLGRATRAALDEAVQFILDKVGRIPWEAPIVASDPSGKVTIKGGADINLQRGDAFDVVLRARELLDADSGKSLGFVEDLWGKVIIDEVQPEVSLGHIVEGRRPPPAAVIRQPGVRYGGGSGLVATSGDGAGARAAGSGAGTTRVAPTAGGATPTAAGVAAPASGAPTADASKKALEVPTYYDVAPIAPAGTKPADADANGIPRSLYAKQGRPSAVVGADRLVLAQSIEFDFNAATLTGPTMNLLDQVTFLLAAKPELGRVRIEGHTDNVGNPAFNQRLSQARAMAVANYLVARGLPRERLSSAGLGFSKPLGDNATEAGRKKNRRVEFVFER